MSYATLTASLRGGVNGHPAGLIRGENALKINTPLQGENPSALRIPEIIGSSPILATMRVMVTEVETGAQYTIEEDVGEQKRYLCTICGYANDPNIFAMEKIGLRWYHIICIRKAALWAIDRGFRWIPEDSMG